MSKKEINVNGLIIRTSKVGEDHYISLTDLAKSRKAEPIYTIRNWVKTSDTLDYLKEWEIINNPNFKQTSEGLFKGYEALRLEKMDMGNLWVMNPGKWHAYTNGIAFEVKRGRYGGTWAHEDIALEFASWMSAKFKLFVYTEFKRLKVEEQKRLGDPFNIKRFLTSGSYSLLVSSILSRTDERLLTHPQPYKKRLPFAAEADMINEIVFGETAKQWRFNNPDKPTNRNQRDYASILELTILNHLEFLDALLIQWDVEDLEERKTILRNTYDFVYPILKRSKTIKNLQDLADKNG